MEKPTKEQYAQTKAQYKEYKESIYADHPEVKKFVGLKRKWIGFLILFGLALSILNAVLATLMSGRAGMALLYSAVAAVAGFGVTFIFLVVSMGPNWRFAFFLFLSGAGRIMSMYESVSGYYGIHSPGEVITVYASAFGQMPFLTILEILSWVYGLLLILTAALLTIPNRSRELAVQSEMLEGKLKNFGMNNKR